MNRCCSYGNIRRHNAVVNCKNALCQEAEIRIKSKCTDDRSNKPIYTINYIKNAAIQQIRNNIDQTIFINIY